MVRPMTNCRPMIRIAWLTASRITGSPSRATSRRIVPPIDWPSNVPSRIDAAGEHQRPGRRIHEQRLALAEVPSPNRHG